MNSMLTADGKRILVLANCQTGGLSACLTTLLPSALVSSAHWSETDEGVERSAQAAAEADIVITSAPKRLVEVLADRHGFDRSKVFRIPSIFFPGFDPDLTYASANGKPIYPVITSPYHSAIGIWCWKKGLSVDRTASYFTAQTMAHLGYDRFWTVATAQTRGHFSETQASFSDFFMPLQSSGERFMHTSNHPSIKAIALLSKNIARQFGAKESQLDLPLHDLIPDALGHEMTWPIYPGIGEQLGLKPYLIWRIYGQLYDLESYLDAQFRALSAAEGEVTSTAADFPDFDVRMQQIVG